MADCVAVTVAALGNSRCTEIWPTPIAPQFNDDVHPHANSTGRRPRVRVAADHCEHVRRPSPGSPGSSSPTSGAYPARLSLSHLHGGCLLLRRSRRCVGRSLPIGPSQRRRDRSGVHRRLGVDAARRHGDWPHGRVEVRDAPLRRLARASLARHPPLVAPDHAPGGSRNPAAGRVAGHAGARAATRCQAAGHPLAGSLQAPSSAASARVATSASRWHPRRCATS
jgi:hypothetical protein